jgi:hypothetical protein
LEPDETAVVVAVDQPLDDEVAEILTALGERAT